MRTLGYVCFAGTEIANSVRTLSYLANCLVGGWEIPGGEDCECDALADYGYFSPADDPAPWFDEDVPESEDFLGIMADVTIDSVIRREVMEFVGEGGSVGRQRPKPRVVAVKGTLVAASAGGLSYGERWLSEVLAGGPNREQLSRDELELLPWCDEDAFRSILRAGTIDGPTFTEITGLIDTFAETVDFQFAGWPYLFSRPSTCIDDTTAQNTTDCCLIEAPSWPGDITTRIQLTAPDAAAVTNITVSLTPTTGDTCPDADRAPYASFTIPTLPRSTRLTIDSRLRTVTIKSPSSDREVSGWDLLSFSGPFTWLDVAPCAKACLCVAVGTSSGTLTTVAQKYSREL